MGKKELSTKSKIEDLELEQLALSNEQIKMNNEQTRLSNEQAKVDIASRKEAGEIEGTLNRQEMYRRAIEVSSTALSKLIGSAESTNSEEIKLLKEVLTLALNKLKAELN